MELSLEEGHEALEACGDEGELDWTTVLQMLLSVPCSFWMCYEQYVPVVPSLCSQ